MMMMSPVAVEEPTVERRACHPSWRDIAAVAEQLRDRRVALQDLLSITHGCSGYGDLKKSPDEWGLVL
jgi:hypothetical protein